MSKRNISYIKPQDPSFLAKLKAEIGYKELGIEAKKPKLEQDSESDGEERPPREDEQPQIVVLQSGDLTAEQVAKEEARLVKEAAEAPADLNQKIVFQKPKPKDTAVGTEEVANKPQENKTSNKDSKRQAKQSKSQLSFNDDEVEEEQDE